MTRTRGVTRTGAITRDFWRLCDVADCCPVVAPEEEDLMDNERCWICGDRGADGDPVVEYFEPKGGRAHVECAESEGWE